MSEQKIGFDMTFTGLVRGVIEKPREGGGNRWVEHLFCVEGDEFTTHQFRIKKEDVDLNIMPKLDALKGQVVTFRCSAQHRSWKDKVYTDYYFQGDLKKAS